MIIYQVEKGLKMNTGTMTKYYTLSRVTRSKRLNEAISSNPNFVNYKPMTYKQALTIISKCDPYINGGRISQLNHINYQKRNFRIWAGRVICYENI